jgi:tetratricopeptide (TPR) repeat protein
LYEECLEKRKSVLGKNHPSTLSSLNNLAGLYSDLGDYEGALPLYGECLEKRKSVLGEEHTLTKSVQTTYEDCIAKLAQ